MRLTIFFILLSLGAFAQPDPYNTGLWTAPFTIHVKDTAYKEKGYFKYNPVTNTVTARGTYKASFNFFYWHVFTPILELDAAKTMIVRQIKEDGTIRDTVLYKAAILNYTLTRKKYGWRE